MAVFEILRGTWVVHLARIDDVRGSFVKTYTSTMLDALVTDDARGSAFDLREEFYSTSARDVIRGMHFQLPPHDHVKLVYCAVGAVTDVLLDLRRGPGYGRVASVLLNAASPSLIVIPKGIAHGFRALVDGSLMVYKTSSEYAPTHDAGIRFDSIGFDWKCNHPILSARDTSHPALVDFSSPF
jgi:dTDP-4-dehydrorhamnose 3,5-epimerase